LSEPVRNREFLKDLYAAAKPYRKRIIFGLIAAALASALDAYGPMLLRSGVNALQEARPVGWLYGIAGLIVLVAFVAGVFRFLMRYIVIGASRFIESDIRENYFSHLLSLAPAFFDRNRTGDLMARSTDDIERIRMVFGPALQFSVATTLTIVFSAAMMFYLDVTLAALVLLLAPLIGYAVLAMSSRMHRANLRQQEVYGALEAQIQENMSGFRVIKSFTREEHESSRFAEICKRYFERSMVVARIQALFMPLLSLLIGSGVAGILWIGGQRVMSGAISLGDFIAFMAYLSLMTWPMIALGWITHIYQRGKASQRRLQQILKVPEQFIDEATDDDGDGHAKSNSPLRFEAPAIGFRKVCLRYRDDEPLILNNLDFEIPSGSITAIVGRTGVGKSTLLRVLSRQYEPEAGCVVLSGCPPLTPLEEARACCQTSRLTTQSERVSRKIRWDEIPIGQLRGMMGYVGQTPFLFSDTIHANIAFGKPDASLSEVETAARLACFDEDVTEFTDGYETRIGERGVTLSGGQQQRLTLARALLIDPPILVLDDALSAVDADTEAKIIDNFKYSLKGRTVLLVTHRLAAAEKADAIAVIEKGRIAELGTHLELMDRDGIYAAMYRRQRLAEELGTMA